jgi:hypothetical protein
MPTILKKFKPIVGSAAGAGISARKFQKVACDMVQWRNPYEGQQRVLRRAMKDALRRNNGYISRAEYTSCCRPGQASKAEKLVLRLFFVRPDGQLEWKPEIVSREILESKLDGSLAIDRERILDVWEQSRRPHLRTDFPYLAPTSRKSQLIGIDSFSRTPVLGTDVLVRPPTAFAQENANRTEIHDLMVGRESVALIIHGNFRDHSLISDGEYLARLVVGDTLAIPKVVDLIPIAAGRCELAMMAPLMHGDLTTAVRRALGHLNVFARDVTLAFVN